jgi:hypothetical protein
MYGVFFIGNVSYSKHIGQLVLLTIGVGGILKVLNMLLTFSMQKNKPNQLIF